MQPSFRDLYRQCCRRHLLEQGPEEVRICLSQLVETPVRVEEHTIQRFKDIRGYRISIGQESAFFPKSLKELEGEHGIARMRRAFRQIDLVLPPYCAMGFLSKAGADIERLRSDEERERFAYWLLTQVYNEGSIAALCFGVYKDNKAIAPFFAHILESIEAHYLGLDRAAILTLIPCIEGIIRNIGDQVDEKIASDISKEALMGVLGTVQKRYIRRSIYQGYDWVPEEAAEVRLFDQFDEAMQMIESVKFFIRQSLYEHTSKYSNPTGLNRHGIVHGFISDFDTPANYLRLLTMINGLSVASIFAGHAASLFHPPDTPESTALARDFMQCSAFAASTGK